MTLTVAGVFAAGVADAAEPAAPNKPADPKAAAADTKGPRIAVEPPVHDFGKALQHKTLTKEFTVKNYGTEELVISNIHTSCGCTVAQLATKTLKPGASTPLVVNLETRANTGNLERTITIESNDPKKTYEIRVKTSVAAEKADAKAN